RGGNDDFVELRRPIETLARTQYRSAVFDAQLHSIAVELHLVSPRRSLWRSSDGLAQLGLDERGHRRPTLFRSRACIRRVVPRRALGMSACNRIFAARFLGIPDCVGRSGF